MTDQEIETWLILKFGSMPNAWAQLNEPLFGQEPRGQLADFTDEEKEVIELYRIRTVMKSIA